MHKLTSTMGHPDTVRAISDLSKHSHNLAGGGGVKTVGGHIFLASKKGGSLNIRKCIEGWGSPISMLAQLFFIQLITPPARRAWRSFKFVPFLFFFDVESWRTAHG